MKRNLLPFFLILLLSSSCGVMMPFPKEAPPIELLNDEPKQKAENNSIQKDDPTTYYTKYFKFNTSAGTIRYAVRMYYGLQEDILNVFGQLDIHKQFNREEFTKFPIASFFPSTSVSIPSDKKEKAISLYKPLIDTIFSQHTKNTELHIELLVLGYTDETKIADDSVLYNELLAKSQLDYLTTQEFQNYSSYFRAKEIGDILSNLIQARKQAFKKYDKIIIDIIQEGRGTELPDIKRTYESVDDKRRITKVYWRILNPSNQ